MKFTSWDYDNNIVTEWWRSGGCNHCGECCKVHIDIFAERKYYAPRDGSENTSSKGLWCEWKAYGRRRLWQIEIDHDESNDCYQDMNGQCFNGSPEKGIICIAWPLHPDHVECFDNCSYSFIKLNEWKIE